MQTDQTAEQQDDLPEEAGTARAVKISFDYLIDFNILFYF